uniref:Uncharacterized protein n=1 Tax=Glossina pallidipes TaxID=7398 RepID=A0A1B0A5A5_GLOPL
MVCVEVALQIFRISSAKKIQEKPGCKDGIGETCEHRTSNEEEQFETLGATHSGGFGSALSAPTSTSIKTVTPEPAAATFLKIYTQTPLASIQVTVAASENNGP